METRLAETLANGDRVVSEIYNSGETKRLEWQGYGARLRMINGDEQLEICAFLLGRINPSSPLQGIKKKPLVLRVIYDNSPHQVVDYVTYSETFQGEGLVAEYRSPKDILDINEFLRGEWPIPVAWLDAEGAKHIKALADVVRAEPGTIQEVGGETPVRLEQLAPLPLNQLGTPPLYPVR